jgi:acyl CoA:acetate/3-ketoacid CoA transferase alpha subunit
VQRVVEIGEIDPEVVVTPGIFVDRILDLGGLDLGGTDAAEEVLG